MTNSLTISDISAPVVDGVRTGIGLPMETFLKTVRQFDSKYIRTVMEKSLKPHEHFTVNGSNGISVTVYNNSDEMMQCRNATIVKLIYLREDSRDSHIGFGKGASERSSYLEIKRKFREADEMINRPEDSVQYLWYEGDLTVSMFFKNGKLHEMILTDIAGILGL